MRAKQSTTQLTQSSLAQTILPSTANSRGRKSRAAEAPAAVVEAPPPPAPSAVPAPLQAPMEFAGAPAPEPAAPELAAPAWSPPSPPSPPAQTTAPAWSPPTPAAAPNWGMSTSRFGNAPAAFGSAPVNPQFGSPPATNYPVNYPATPGFPPQPHYADSPATDYLPPVTAGQWVPQHAAPHHGGTQTAPPAYGPPPFGAPGYGGYPVGATPGRSTASRVLIALAITVVGIIGIGILAAVAIPVFLSQRDKPAARNVVLPATLVDQQRIDGSSDLLGDATSEVASLQKAIPQLTQGAAAYYGEGGQPVFMVAAGKLPHKATSADEKTFFSDTARINNMTLTPVGSGPFGGWMQCGQQTLDGTLITTCASLDSAAVVVVLAASTSPSDLAIVARQVIGAVEQKS